MLFRSRVIFFFLALVSLVLASCRGENTPQGPEIALNLGSEPATLDPALVTDPPTIQLDRLLFLNLTHLNETDGSPQTALAREWLVSSDGLIWEFRLRDDVNWVRYNPDTARAEKLRAVNAQDVVYSARRLFDPRTASSFARQFAPLIRNANFLMDAYPRAQSEDLQRLASALGVTAKNERTVQFQLTRPLGSFPALAATWLGRIQPREPIEQNGIGWTEPGVLWSSGPFMLERWDHNRAIVLRRNPFYFEADQVLVERLRFRMIPDAGSALDAYLRGDLDTTDPYDTIEGDQLARVDEDQTLAKDKRVLPGLCTQYIGFNVTQPPFDDFRVRRAFAMALNRDEIVRNVFKRGQTARWFTPPTVNAAPDISSTIGIEFNAIEAKELLGEAGWGIGRQRLPLLTFGVNANDVFQQTARVALQNWNAALSAEISIEADDWTTYLDKLRKDPPALFRLGYCAHYPDAANFAYDVFHSGSTYNFTRWSNRDYDRLVEQAARETNVIRRRSLYIAAEKLLVQEHAVIIPLVWTSRVSLTNPRVERTHAIMEGYDRVEKWRVNR